MNNFSVPAVFKNGIDESNVAAELGLLDRGWYIYKPNGEHAVFAVSRATVSGMQLTETRLGHCIGRLDPLNQHGAYLSMGLTVSGVSAVEGPYGRIILKAGDILLWHSSIPMNFHIQEPFHLLNLVFCDKYLKSEMQDLPSITGMHFRQQDPFGAILGGFMQGLLSEWQSFSESDLTLALLAARNLMGKAVQRKKGEQRVNSDTKRMTYAMRFIDQNLYDPELTPNKIATALHMSLRSLYLMFSRENLTIHGLIRDRRLEDCRSIIASKRADLSMKQLALSRGFNDLSGFSRAFKRKYGMSPIAFKKWVSTPLQEIQVPTDGAFRD
jgi:AraC-like DNA-binding protein